MSDKRTYLVEIESPHGVGPIEDWVHWMNKVSSEARERWGIEISIERQTEGEASTEEFK